MSETAPATDQLILHQNKISEALAKAQGEFSQPELNRTAQVKKNGELLYETHYADLNECIESIRKPLSANGLSFTQTTDVRGSQWMLILTLRHSSGQMIESFMPLTFNNITPQQIGSQLTYLKRYQVSAFFGLAADFDDDANGNVGNQVNFGDGKRGGQQQKVNAPAAKKDPPVAAQGKLATPAEVESLISLGKTQGLIESEFRGALKEKIGRDNWANLTAVELLLARAGVEAAGKKKAEAALPTTAGMSHPPEDDGDPGPDPTEADRIPEDDLDNAFKHAIAKPDPKTPPAEKPSEKAAKTVTDKLWADGIRKGISDRDLMGILMSRTQKQNWAALTNFEVKAIRNVIDTWNPEKGVS